MNSSRKSDIKRGILLEWFTIGWNFLEAFIAIIAGVIAGSIALVGFGIDSVIEFIAGITLLWRLYIELKGKDAESFEKIEKRAVLIVGITFFMLAAYVLFEAVSILWKKDIPDESTIGIILSIASLIVMPILAYGKIRVAKRIGSRALEADAKETIACSYLSFTLLLGLGLNSWVGWWWADPVAALLMIPWLIKEGFELVGEFREDEEEKEK
ncbi:cation diffusion facilitator family transporter [candidate division KSB1 bacterium]